MLSEVISTPPFCSVTLHGLALSTGSQDSVLRRNSLSKFWLSAFLRNNCASHFKQCIYKLYGMCVEVRRAYVERRETSSLDALTRPSMESGSDVEVRRATASRRRAFASRKRREVEAGAQNTIYQLVVGATNCR